MYTRDVKLSFPNNSIKKFTLWIFALRVTILTSFRENDPYIYAERGLLDPETQDPGSMWLELTRLTWLGTSARVGACVRERERGRDRERVCVCVYKCVCVCVCVCALTDMQDLGEFACVCKCVCVYGWGCVLVFVCVLRFGCVRGCEGAWVSQWRWAVCLGEGCFRVC